jgi:hypothetical protein
MQALIQARIQREHDSAFASMLVPEEKTSTPEIKQEQQQQFNSRPNHLARQKSPQSTSFPVVRMHLLRSIRVLRVSILGP